MSLHCGLEQDTLILAKYWFNPGKTHPDITEKIVDWDVKNKIKAAQLCPYDRRSRGHYR